MRELALADVPDATAALSRMRQHLVSVLAPPSPTSSLSALVELKSGVGGSESSLFAAELRRMYQRLAARRGWTASVVEAVGVEGMGTGDAYKEALVEVTGDGAFGYLRREAGVHRVQRVPATESKGRVHTSTVSIIVRRLSLSFSFTFSCRSRTNKAHALPANRSSRASRAASRPRSTTRTCTTSRTSRSRRCARAAQEDRCVSSLSLYRSAGCSSRAPPC